MNKTLCVALIVKNEEKVIERALSSCKGIIDKIIVCDTGSTDSTLDRIKMFAEINHIEYEIHFREWKNFGWNRTELLKIVKNKSDYVLILDADDIIINNNFDKNKLTDDAYYLRYIGSLSYVQVRIMKNNLDWKYVGVVHEYPECKEAKQPFKELTELKMITPNDGSTQRDDIAILKQGIIDEPNNSRYYFYLGQSYREKGKYQEAIDNYSKCIQLGTWDEQTFYSEYMIGLCYELLGKLNEAKIFYLKAWEFRPTRAESLYKLSNLCRNQKEYQQAYLFANKGLQIDYPKDLLFIESNIYKYLLLFERSISSYYVGNYQESYSDCLKILQMNEVPEKIKNQTKINIKFSEEKLNKKWEELKNE